MLLLQRLTQGSASCELSRLRDSVASQGQACLGSSLQGSKFFLSHSIKLTSLSVSSHSGVQEGLGSQGLGHTEQRERTRAMGVSGAWWKMASPVVEGMASSFFVFICHTQARFFSVCLFFQHNAALSPPFSSSQSQMELVLTT